MNNICKMFPIGEDEYSQLEEAYGRLCYHEAHDLKKKNTLNNYTDDVDDIYQELQLALLQAGSYYKRQLYIEKCFDTVAAFAKKDAFLTSLVVELKDLWANRTRHGANRQRFGDHQERLLERIIRRTVPRTYRPSKNQPLQIDSKFARYCKAITWNKQKAMGKKITKEKSIRTGLVSLSEYDALV